MNLNQLRYVKAVAETGSFTTAAELCYVTQPALSNAISNLEHELEERLFARTTRNVTLTPFGLRLMPYICKVLEAQDDLELEAREFLQTGPKLVRIGVSPLISEVKIKPLLEEYGQEAPQVEFSLLERDLGELVRMLENGLTDFIFKASSANNPSWEKAFLYREPLYLVSPDGGPAGKAGKAGHVVAGQWSGASRKPAPTAAGSQVEAGIALSAQAEEQPAQPASGRSGGDFGFGVPGLLPGPAMLGQWALLGHGTVVAPESKIPAQGTSASLLKEKSGREMSLEFEAVWLSRQPRHPHLEHFARFLRKGAKSKDR